MVGVFRPSSRSSVPSRLFIDFFILISLRFLYLSLPLQLLPSYFVETVARYISPHLENVIPARCVYLCTCESNSSVESLRFPLLLKSSEDDIYTKHRPSCSPGSVYTRYEPSGVSAQPTPLTCKLVGAHEGTSFPKLIRLLP